MNKDNHLFTEQHARALILNGILEFNLTPTIRSFDDISPALYLVANNALPMHGEYRRFRKESQVALFQKMSEWSSKKTSTDQAQFYGELAKLTSIDRDVLTPTYLTDREEAKFTLKTATSLIIMNHLLTSATQEYADKVNQLPVDCHVTLAERFGLFARSQRAFDECNVNDEPANNQQAVASLISKIGAISADNPSYLQLNLVLAMIVGRNDLVKLIEKCGCHTGSLPETLLDDYKPFMMIETDEDIDTHEQERHIESTHNHLL